ncbi:MAG: RidA family protein [Dysgonamonadaceae bacterium]|jgi:2-iminobutanoate/2-iminopropanoate deaminase|nr:RidA family protein [Dysgonamonadaceae bacterium]MDD3356421.1 RidA family protein [Dysgonamonadaceae bacterium]MDD3727855.1 RidA family protein [Dysgonamonadaceae bacterium]MDD4245907.1 RidA family protein [Dysgonamonadaceae bacterium]MDD4605525.1 RidA family protein [Dysgonamonadaceae bacterium]
MKKEISTTNAPAAIGPYSQGVEKNGIVFVSGQLPVDSKTGETAKGGIKGQTLQIFKNIEAILKEVDMTLDNVVKTTVFLTDMADFADMNEVYASQFSGTFPARSAFAVKGLPKNADIEIEVIAVR